MKIIINKAFEDNKAYFKATVLDCNNKEYISCFGENSPEAVYNVRIETNKLIRALDFVNQDYFDLEEQIEYVGFTET